MNKTLIFVSIIFSLLIIACEEKENDTLQPNSHAGKEVVFSISEISDIQTRATDIAFEENDEIGIFVVKRNSPDIPGILQTSGNFADNKLYIVRNGRLQPYSDAEKIYLAAGDTYDFYAFSPYQNIQNFLHIFSVGSNQTTKSSYQFADLKQAKTLNIKSTNNNVYLPFRHLMALIEVHFKKEPEFEVTGVNSCLLSKSQINIQTGEISNVNYSTQLQMYKYGETEANYIYRAIVPEQKIQANQQLFRIKRNDNTEMVYKADNDDFFLKGGTKKVYSFGAQYRCHVFSYQKDWGSVLWTDSVFNHGDIVTVTALPNSNFDFDCWYIQDSTLSKVSTNKSYSFPIMRDIFLGANFKREEVLVTVNIKSLPDNSKVGGEVKGSIGLCEINTQGRVVAYPFYGDKGYVFLGFYDQNGNLLQTSNDYEFIIPAHNIALEARFEKQYCIINYSTQGGGHLSASIDGSAWGNGTFFKKNTLCIVRGLAQNGFTFQGWYENGVLVSTASEYQFYASTDRILVARFLPKQYQIEINTNNSAWSSGSVTGKGSYSYGSPCTMKATVADEYCRFLGWYEGDKLLSMDMDYTFTVLSNRTFLAKFDRALIQGSRGARIVFEAGTATNNIQGGTNIKLVAGTKIQSFVKMGYEESGGNNTSPYSVNYTLEVICEGKIVFSTSHPENDTFIIPKDGAYTFNYCINVLGNFSSSETLILWGTWDFLVWKN